jgi:hypothetical protein
MKGKLAKTVICESYSRVMVRRFFSQDLLYLPNQSLTLANKLSWFILDGGIYNHPLQFFHSLSFAARVLDPG